MNNQKTAEQLAAIQKEIGKVVVGQEAVVESLLLALLCDGHVLLEGAPGLAKSLLCSTLAATLHADFSRIQFTPDLLPGDILGTPVYNQQTGEFRTHRGPIFTNILLSDEINRAPAKVQSALLEAMQERQVSIGDESMSLPPLFMVLATQNPIEQEGTYRLPEAQLDRFLFKLNIAYPTHTEEKEIAKRMALNLALPEATPVLTPDDILAMRAAVDEVRVEDKLYDYAVDIAEATRDCAAQGLPQLQPLIRYGASPRASIALIIAGRARAMFAGRDYVIPDDIKNSGGDILRHRIVLSYEAMAEQVSADEIVKTVLDHVEVAK